MGGTHHSISNGVDDDYEGDGIPLSDATRAIVIAIHYAAIPAVTICIWCFLERYSIFQERIWSPFLLIVALTWLLIAATFEIGNHFYIDNWQLYDPQSDLINGSFSFFNFGAQNLLALSLRKQGHAFCRKPSSSLSDWLGLILDPILMVLIIINPIVYGVAGRSTANTALSPLAAMAGLFTLFRVWKNLGPNLYTLFGGIGFFVLAILGVVSFAIYNSTDAEWVHIFIGGCFVASTIPLSIGFYNAQSLHTIQQADGKHDNITAANKRSSNSINNNEGEHVEEYDETSSHEVVSSQPAEENI